MRTLLPALLLVSLALAGCGGNTQSTVAPQPLDTGMAPSTGSATSTPTATTSSSSSSSSTSSAPRAAKTFDVAIQNNAFAGGTLTVQKGDTVRWTQKDSTAHSVKADDGSFGSGSANDGECPGAGCMTTTLQTTYSHTFGAVGSFAYHCDVHPGMTGTVTVVETMA